MIEHDRLICYCNDKTVADIVDLIKANQIQTLDDLINQVDVSVGDKCEACLDEGYENDGYSLAMVLSLVKQGRL
jgi:NAD(P)H-nitrite reductase large subunit